MGFIKTIFGSIFGLIGGLFKAIVGIFGIGKKSEFYLEADDADGGSSPAVAPQDVAPPATPKSATEPAAVTPAASTPAAAPAPAQPEAPVAAVAPAPAKPEPVGNFATDYLNGSSGTMTRRRPGPSLSPFKDMAKQVKVPFSAR
jgi:hypothetical protein